jgi:hypothetical protein
MDVEVKGLDKLIAKLTALGEEIGPALEQALRQGVYYLHQKTPPYPPASGGSYRRTMTLGRSVTTWQGQSQGALSRVEGRAGTWRGIIGTAVPYAQFVIGDNQARPHRGRWWQLRKVVAANVPGVIRKMEDAVRKLLAGSR